MKLGKATWGYGLIVLIYLMILLWGDTQKGFLEFLPNALRQLPVLMFLALVSFGLRYARWFYLLCLGGSYVPVWRGWLSYLSGFAFTATPGKVGELLRIHYFSRLKVESSLVMAAFVFERTLDLVVVFCLAALWAVDTQMYIVVSTFVGGGLLVVSFVMYRPKSLDVLGIAFIGNGWGRVGRLLCFVAKAMENCAVWLRPVPLLLSLLLGFGAWCTTAIAFVYLLITFQLHLPFLAAFSAYPLAMLAGAASMMPGGLGTTETAIVIQLQTHGVPVSTALLVAVAVRLGTMWFSVFLGFTSIYILSKWKN